MKLAIVPALALAAAGGAALMASPASATPEVNRQTTAPAAAAKTPDARYGQNGTGEEGDVCVIHQWFPGTNILSGYVLNDAVDAPVDVIVQVITLLTTADITSDKPITNNC